MSSQSSEATMARDSAADDGDVLLRVEPQAAERVAEGEIALRAAAGRPDRLAAKLLGARDVRLRHELELQL